MNGVSILPAWESEVERPSLKAALGRNSKRSKLSVEAVDGYEGEIRILIIDLMRQEPSLTRADGEVRNRHLFDDSGMLVGEAAANANC
jgi:hypothetical protein